MNIVFVLLPLSLLLAVIGLLGFLWANRDGQFDDVDSPALRALLDDDGSECADAPPPEATSGAPTGSKH